MLSKTRQLLWRLLALVALLAGFIGAFLPVIPTVPFVLLAAWAAGKGWPELERWLLAHPHFGRSIRDWRESGVVSRKAKLLATTMMAGSAIGIWFVPVSPWIQAGVCAVLFAVATWLWTRPEQPRQ